MEAWRQELYLAHHGIKGQKWGVRKGPPYPLDAKDHTVAEKKAGWRKSLNGGSSESVGTRKMSSVDIANGKVIAKKALLVIGATAAVAVGVGVAVKVANSKNVSPGVNVVETVEKVLNQNADVPIETLKETFSDVKETANQNIDVPIKPLKETVQSSKKTFPSAKEFSEHIAAISKKTLANEEQGRLFDHSHWDSLTQDQKTAISNYTYEYSEPTDGKWSYKEINGFLRHGDTQSPYRKDVEKATKDCADAIDGSILKEDAVSFRGVSYYSVSKMLGLEFDPRKPLSEKTINELQGREFTEKGFYSSSIDPASALSGLQITTIIPKGTKAMYIAPVSQKTAERELLIQRGTKFTIRSVVTDRKGALERLVVEAISQP